jgi:hypothetical protein
MKKGLILLFAFIFLASIVSINAFEITLPKTSFSPGETLQLEIPDIFIRNLAENNFGIYKTGILHKMPLESGLTKVADKYYYYAVLPEIAGDYSLRIENTIYYDNSAQKTDALVRNFSIIASNQSYLSFNPGHAFVSSDFSFIVKAYNAPQKINIRFLANDFNQTLTLGYGSTRIIYVPINNITDYTLSSIKINDYTMPVIVSIKNNSLVNTTPAINLENDIRYNPKEIELSLLKDISYLFSIIIKNDRNYEIPLNITASPKEIVLSRNNFTLFESSDINFTISAAANFSGNINISNANSTISIPIKVSITRNESQVNFSVIPENFQRTCRNLNGTICKSNEKCSGLQSDATDGTCCLAECKASSSSNSWIWALVLILFLLLGGYFLWKKSKEKTKEENPSEIVKRRIEDYEKRMSAEESNEVRRSLAKE